MDNIILLLVTIILAQTTYLVVASSSKNKRAARQSIYVDTSVLIDGRILSIAEAGFIPGELVIPRSVLRELQLLADGADSDKRAKARKGLDLVRKLQSIEDVSVRIFQDGYNEHGVDEQLMELAKKYQGSICTVDYNLNKVAQVEGIAILNINELAKNIRSVYLPGEQAKIELVAKGQDSHQGVGYLDDGTMVVVEKAVGQVGNTVDVEFIRVLQTDAGKMLFAKLVKTNLRDNRSDAQSTKQVTKQKSLGRRVRRTEGGKKPAESSAATVAKKHDKDKSSNGKPAPRTTKSRAAKPVESKGNDIVADKPQRPRANTRRSSGGRSKRSQEDSLLDLIDKQ